MKSSQVFQYKRENSANKQYFLPIKDIACKNCEKVKQRAKSIEFIELS